MKFLHLTALALSAAQASAFSSKDVVSSIKKITDLSTKANDGAKDLDMDKLKDNLPKVTDNLKDIVQESLKNIEDLSKNKDSKFSDSEQSDVCKSITDFVDAQETFLETVNKNDAILSTNQLTIPLASVIQVLEGTITKLNSSLADAVPSCKDQTQKDFKKLDKKFEKTVDKLNKLVPGGTPAVASGLAKVGDSLAKAAPSGSSKSRRGLNDPAGAVGGTASRLKSSASGLTTIATAAPSAARKLDARQLKELNNTLRDVISHAGHAHKTGSASKPAPSPGKNSAQGGASDGSTGGLLGGLLAPNNGKGGRSKRFEA